MNSSKVVKVQYSRYTAFQFLVVDLCCFAAHHASAQQQTYDCRALYQSASCPYPDPHNKPLYWNSLANSFPRAHCGSLFSLCYIIRQATLRLYKLSVGKRLRTQNSGAVISELFCFFNPTVLSDSWPAPIVTCSAYVFVLFNSQATPILFLCIFVFVLFNSQATRLHPALKRRQDRCETSSSSLLVLHRSAQSCIVSCGLHSWLAVDSLAGEL